MSGSERPSLPAVHRARAPASIEVRSARIAEVEAMLASGKRPRDVRREVAEKWGITANAARRYVRAVHMLWNGEAGRAATVESRAEKRAHYDAMLMAVIEKGMKRQDMKLDKDGGEHFVDNPDVRGVVAAVETLARLHGVIDPDKKDGGSPIAGQTLVLLQQFFGVRQAPGEAPALPGTEQAVRVIDAKGEDDGE